MKILFTSLILLLAFVSEIHSMVADSSRTGMNGIYAETYILRHDFSEGFASLNYERVLGKKRNTTLRIGVYPEFESTVSFPVTVTWITRPSAKHHFEFGTGVVFRIEHYMEWFYDIPAIMLPVMYRYQTNTGVYFRGGINIFVSWPTLPSPSLSIGYRF